MIWLAWGATVPFARAQGASGVVMVADLLGEFAPNQVRDSLATEVRRPGSAGGVKVDALFEHPLEPGREAAVDYELTLPALGNGASLVFAFDLALADGIKLAEGDGVRFRVAVGDEIAFTQDCHECVWRSYAVDLARWAGRKVKLSLRTDCRQNSAYDWALWGNPRVLLVNGRTLAELQTPGGAAVQLAAGVVLVAEPPAGLQRLRLRAGDAAPVEWNRPAAAAGAATPVVLDFGFTNRQPVRVEWEPRAALTAGQVRLAPYAPTLRLERTSPTRALWLAGGEAPVRVVVRNVGRGSSAAGQAGVELRLGEKLLAGLAVPALLPGEAWEGEAGASLPKMAGDYDLAARLTATALGAPATELHRSVAVYPAATGGDRVVANAGIRVDFVPGGQGGYGYARIAAPVGGGWETVAIWRPLFEIESETAGGPRGWRLQPHLAPAAAGDTVRTLVGDGADADGVVWQARLTLTPAADAGRVKLHYEWTPAQDRRVRALRGPNLYVGEGTTGAGKEWGLFPGLEYLYGAERSSNPRDFAPPIDDRRMPRSDKITLPLMAVTIGVGSQAPTAAGAGAADRFFTPDALRDGAGAPVPSGLDGRRGVTVGLYWDMNQKWDGRHTMPAAHFSSPNLGEGMANHRLALFLPSGKDGVPENGERAAEPFTIIGGSTVTLDATLVVVPGPALGVVRDYFQQTGGLPAPTAWPRSFEAELDLCRTGFLKTIWDAGKAGWRHCAGWAAGPAPGFATLLWMDAHVAEAPAARAAAKERVEFVGQQLLAAGGPGLLTSQAACHIMQWELPFYYGALPEALAALEPQVAGLERAQTPAGGWLYAPGNAEQAGLGRVGDSVLGTCANHAALLLRYARLTGDPGAQAAGERALVFMEQFRVPRGGQTWECPMYEPDILAAAYAIRAYHDAYRITRNPRWLHDAEYWAESGVPFIYGWSQAERPMMLGATIPVFGSTFYTHTWLAVPVQWCGLVYAYHVRHLAEDLVSPGTPAAGSPLPLSLGFTAADWRRVVDLITASAVQQQIVDGDLQGLYPDSIGDFRQRNPAYINPEDILLNVLAQAGHDPDIQTVRLGAGDAAVVISSGAGITNAALTGTTALRFALTTFSGETSHTLVRGRAPREIRVDGQPLVRRDQPVRRETGWSWDATSQRACLNVPHPQARVEVEVRY